MQLAAVDSVSGGAAYFACSYAADFAILINGNLIVNLNIAAVQNDGGSAVGDFVASYVDICQFCTLISIYAILGCNIAGGFDSTIGTADAYIFAGQVTKDDIFIQVNLVELLAVNIGFFNVDVVAAYYLAVLACFGCYRMQLAAVYSIGGISGYCTCCYTGNLAVLIDGYFAKFSGFRSNLAIVAVIVTNEQFTVTQRAVLVEYAVVQNYVADFACSCSYFAVFINGEFIVCCVEIAGAVYKERHNSVFCHSAYGQVVFGVQCVSLNGVYINVFVQLNLNLSAVMAYADVLVAAEINKITGFYIGCFGCNTVGSEVPAHVSSCTYCLQLTYVYCIIIVNACSYACNTAILVYGYCIVDSSGITKQFYGCALTVSQFGCKAAQGQLSIAIADGFDSSQILIQFNLNSFNAVFCILAYADILVTIEVNIIAGFYIFCFGQNTISSKLPRAVLQLAYIYSISIGYACSYVGNYFIISIQTISGNISFTAIANALIIIHEEVTSINAVNIKISVQFNINKSSKIGFFLAYGNIFIVTAEVNDSTGFNFSRVGDFFPGGKIPACIFSSSLQLCYVYSIGSSAASCYIGNLTSKGSTAYRYSTTVGSPSKAVCILRSKCTNYTTFSISNRRGTNCNAPISFCFGKIT